MNVGEGTQNWQHLVTVNPIHKSNPPETDTSMDIKIAEPRIITTKYLKNVESENGTQIYNVTDSWNMSDWTEPNQKPIVTVNENEDVQSKNRYQLIEQKLDNLNLTYGDKITYNIRLYNVGDEDADFTDEDLELEGTKEPSVLIKEDGEYYIYDNPNDNLEFVDGDGWNWESAGNGKYKLQAAGLETIKHYEEKNAGQFDSWSKEVSIKFRVVGDKNSTSATMKNNNSDTKRDDERRKFLYSFTQKNALGEYQTFKVPEPDATVDFSYPVGNEKRFNYNPGDFPYPTIMDGDTLVYCIRYYSIGVNKTQITDTVPDTYGEGLEYVQGSAITQDGTPISVKQNGNTLEIDPPKNVVLDGCTNQKPPYYDIYLTFKAKVEDPEGTPLLENKINDGRIIKIPTAYEIKGKVFIDNRYTNASKVTEDRNAIYDEDKEDELVEGIKVELLDAEDKTPAVIKDPFTNLEYHNVTYTNSNGEYSFTHLPARIKIMKSDGTELDNIDVSKSYIVRFTYNGQVYENIQYEKEEKSKKSSYSTEEDKERNSFNEGFKIINGGNSTEKTILDSSDSYKKNGLDTKDIHVYKSGGGVLDDRRNGEHGEPSGTTCPEEYAIYAYSGKNDRIVSVGTPYREYVNLGLLRRHFDLTLENKLVSMDVSINGVNQTLESISGGVIQYNALESDIKEREKNGTYDQEAFYSELMKIYNQDVYFKESDYKYEEENELNVWVNYEVTIRNESKDNFIGYLNNLNFYYDKRFDDIKINGTQVTGNNSVDGFKKSNTEQFKNTRITNDANGALKINISLHLSRETIRQAIEESKDDFMRTFETIAEIESYSNEYGQDENGQDMYNNGHTGIAGKIDEDSDAGNLDMAKYIGEVRKSTDPKTILSFFNSEDDARRALGVKLQKDTDIGESKNEKRKLVGTVFEDATTKNNDNTRLGDGIKNENKPVKGATVELYEGENIAKVYNNSSWENATAETDEEGNYKIEGFIPSANYTIRITYGNGETTIYNAQDYKSTIDVTGDNYKEPTLQGKNAPNSPDGNEYWYEHQNIKNKSVAKDINMKMENSLELNNTTATYLENYTNAGTTNELKGKQADDYFKNTAKTAKIFAPIRWLGNTKTDSDGYQIQNINLGLAERPRAELTLTKEVDHISIVATDGTTIVDGTQGAKGISWTPRYVQPIIDENLIYGSTMKVTYKFKITNTGEVDYFKDNFTRDFYDYGRKLAENNIATTTPKTLIDYIDPKLIYDEKTSSYEGKENSAYWKDYDDTRKTITLEDDLTSHNLKPGDDTGYIAYLTFEKVLSDANAQDLLTYNNYAEIKQSENKVGRRSYSTWSKGEDKNDCYLLSDLNRCRGIINVEAEDEDTKNKDEYVLTIPENLNAEHLYNGKWSTLYDPVNANGGYAPFGEPDTDAAQEIQIIQPFGASTSQKILIWTITGTIAGLILAGGIYLIKKKVL